MLRAPLVIFASLLALGLVSEAARADNADAPPPARREESDGLVLGLRTGFAFAEGTSYGTNAGGSRSFASSYAGMVPVWVDAGYRFGRFYFGPFVQYGFAFPSGSSCPSGASCSGSDVRVGMTADYHFLDRRTWDPWIGLGLGYEWAAFHAKPSGTAPSLEDTETIDDSLRGVEMFDLQVGADFDVAKAIRFGAFVMASFAEFTDFETTTNGATTQGRITDQLGPPSPHGWVLFGFRSRFEL